MAKEDSQRKSVSKITFTVEITDNRNLFEQINKPLSKNVIVSKLQYSNYGRYPYYTKSKIKIKSLESTLSNTLMNCYKTTSEYAGYLILKAVDDMIKKHYPIMGNFNLNKCLNKWQHESFPRKLKGRKNAK